MAETKESPMPGPLSRFLAADHVRLIHLVGETTAMLFIGEEIDRERQSTPGEHGHQTVLSKGTDQTIERHG